MNGSLPLELDGFVGRRAELPELTRALDASRLVTVTGPGGIGKSRLVVRVAGGRCAPAHGVWHVELADVRDPKFVDYAVVESLGLTDHTARPPRETLLTHLTGRQLLLVRDGFECIWWRRARPWSSICWGRCRRWPCSRWDAGRWPSPASRSSRWARWARTRRWNCSHGGPDGWG